MFAYVPVTIVTKQPISNFNAFSIGIHLLRQSVALQALRGQLTSSGQCQWKSRELKSPEGSSCMWLWSGADSRLGPQLGGCWLEHPHILTR